MTTLNPFREGSWEHAAYREIDLAIGRWEILPEDKWNEMMACSFQELYETGAYTALFARSLNPTWNQTAFVEFLAKKQHDYGCENILKFGQEGIKVRMWDKIARITNLVGRDDEAENEPLQDSYTDLAGYLVLLWMVNQGTFTAPLEQDMPADDGIGQAFMEATQEHPMDMHEIVPTHGGDTNCYYGDSIVLIPNGGIIIKDGIQYPTFTIHRTLVA